MKNDNHRCTASASFNMFSMFSAIMVPPTTAMSALRSSRVWCGCLGTRSTSFLCTFKVVNIHGWRCIVFWYTVLCVYQHVIFDSRVCGCKYSQHHNAPRKIQLLSMHSYLLYSYFRGETCWLGLLNVACVYCHRAGYPDSCLAAYRCRNCTSDIRLAIRHGPVRFTVFFNCKLFDQTVSWSLC